jgi:hypothetical protein
VVVINGITRFYVGQSFDLSVRILDHNKPSRYATDSLHHLALRTLNENFFVVLCDMALPKEPTAATGLVLNIIEMWGVMLFRSLSAHTLQPWMPPNTTVTNDYILNTALPLLQGQKEPEKDWAYLRGTEDPLLKEYYAKRVEQATEQLAQYRALQGDRMRAQYLEEELVEVRGYEVDGGRTRRTVLIRGVFLTIPPFCDIVPGTVRAVFELRDHPHPNKLAEEAHNTDPAMNLGVEIVGVNGDGNAVTCWLTARGDRNVLKVNTLCDFLRGIPKEETEKTPRRYYYKKTKRGKGEHCYNF